VNSASNRPVLLLVHGGHHGPWSWERLQEVLAAEGWESHAVSLPSAVRNKHLTEPLPGMYDDARVIRDTVDGIDGPVVVVAHSQGGVSATEATAGAANVVHIVYVASYLPRVGEGLLQLHGVPVPQSLAGVRPPENPDFNQPASFYDGDATNPDTAAAIARLVPQSVRADFETVTQAGWLTIPTSYVIPEQDVSVVATVEDRMAARADAVYRCPGHHAPFYSNPDEFAALLARIVDTVPAVR
jgi:pimeloyl-ACP methyl ester carboxylesterase